MPTLDALILLVVRTMTSAASVGLKLALDYAAITIEHEAQVLDLIEP